MKITIRIYDNEDRSSNSGTKPELSGFATIGMLEYWVMEKWNNGFSEILLTEKFKNW